MLFFISVALWSLLATAILQAIFHHLMAFRSEWFDTLLAAVLTCGVVGAAYFCANRIFDNLETLRILGSSFAVAFPVGLLAFRWMVKSEERESLSWRVSAGVALVLVAVPLVVMLLVLFAS